MRILGGAAVLVLALGVCGHGSGLQPERAFVSP